MVSLYMKIPPQGKYLVWLFSRFSLATSFFVFSLIYVYHLVYLWKHVTVLFIETTFQLNFSL